MYRGIRFNIKQDITKPLYEILKCINIKEYDWYNVLSQNETWYRENDEWFLNNDYYSGSDFLKVINQKHYVIFVKLQVYSERNEYKNIHSYKEFIESNCQIIVLVYDCEKVEIYSKSSEITNKLYENALLNKYENIEYISDENDRRTKMDIR